MFQHIPIYISSLTLLSTFSSRSNRDLSKMGIDIFKAYRERVYAKRRLYRVYYYKSNKRCAWGVRLELQIPIGWWKENRENRGRFSDEEGIDKNDRNVDLEGNSCIIR